MTDNVKTAHNRQHVVWVKLIVNKKSTTTIICTIYAQKKTWTTLVESFSRTTRILKGTAEECKKYTAIELPVNLMQ